MALRSVFKLLPRTGIAVRTVAAPTFSRFFSVTRRFTETHEWMEIDGSLAKLGVTDHAQAALGDIVFVELPDVDSDIAQGDTAGSIESVKAASDVYSPVDGKVIKINEALADEPSLMNASPEKDGWMVQIEMSDTKQVSELMDEGAYKKFCDEEEH